MHPRACSSPRVLRSPHRGSGGGRAATSWTSSCTSSSSCCTFTSSSWTLSLVCWKMVSKGLHRLFGMTFRVVSMTVSIYLVKFKSINFMSVLASTVFDHLCNPTHLSFPAQGCSGSPLLLPAKLAPFAAASLLVQWASPLLLPSFWLERSAQVEPTSSVHQNQKLLS